MKLISSHIVNPTLKAMATMNLPFTGLLYPGLIMTPVGPHVLEFNARLGDPEAQCYMRLLKTDLLDVVEACIDGRLKDLEVEWYPGFAVCVVIASGGYPGPYEKGFEIHGLREASRVPGVVVFHGGTTLDDGRLRTAGGRVLSISARSMTLKDALDHAYEAVSHIRFPDMHYRKDIGRSAMAMSQ